MDLSGNSPLRFLLGTWEGEGGGEPGEGSGGFTFTMDLQSRVIVRTNYATYPEMAERPAFRHDDLMVIYTDPHAEQLCAIYFDSEGHVISYAVEQSHDSEAVRFTSEAISGSPRYRLTYTPTGPDNLTLTFEVAPPDQPDDFAVYISARACRERAR